MEYLTKDGRYQDLFPQNQGTFLNFQKKAGEASPPFLPSRTPAYKKRLYSLGIRHFAVLFKQTSMKNI